jgi:hypothetical protein
MLLPMVLSVSEPESVCADLRIPDFAFTSVFELFRLKSSLTQHSENTSTNGKIRLSFFFFVFFLFFF